ncbi:MAG: hypothetical protein ACOX21_05890 [Bacillota bacterium]|nr:hypothetical protein [Bacillota bacterium]HOC06320.1 hypothetical protein [Bacillota bacterium]HPZ22664.1 hypothetical protein [Bacillota bacterium]HQD20270.1 hypothetical protein [Bacillota bacterium]
MIAKKIFGTLGLLIIMAFIYLGLLYLWYSVYSKTGDYVFFCLGLALILLVSLLVYHVLNKLGWYGSLVNGIMVFASVILGVGALKILLVSFNEL